MKKAITFLLLCSMPNMSFAQIMGNIGYTEPSGSGKARVEISERNKHIVPKDDQPPSTTSSFVECNVLMNVKADQYVAVFGLNKEATTLADCAKEMDANIQAFTAELKALGVDEKDIFVDFISHNKTYGYEKQGDILQEKHVGFNLKKNVMIHYTDESLLEKVTLAAAKVEVFDLVKVDYIVSDMQGIQDKLMEQASQITKAKIDRYQKLLGIKLQAPAQIYAEKFATYFPTQLYDSYVAQESESVYNSSNRDYTVRTARKSRTSFFNGLDANGFDVVINPANTEPVVQFTLYLKLKYEVEQPKPN